MTPDNSNATQDAAAIEFRSVSIQHGTRQLFANFNARIAPREQVVFSGPSGSGKSSLLLALLGFVPIQAGGEILVNGVMLSAATITKIRTTIAYVPQEPVGAAVTGEQDPCVQDFLDAVFRLRVNRGNTPTPGAIAAIFEELGLPGAATSEKSLRKLSGGEKQRVALATALLSGRSILVLDEPSAALDAASRDQVIAAIRARPELTVLRVSHDPEWVRACDREVGVTSNRAAQSGE